MFSAPHWRASVAAEGVGDYIEKLKRDKVPVARYPNNAAAWFGLGSAFGGMNFADDAITAYRQAIKIQPDLDLAWYNLGLRILDSGRTDDAITAFRQAIKIEPDEARVWSYLGVVYEDFTRAY